jgi:repressor LexA
MKKLECVGKNLKLLRLEKGLSQKEVGKVVSHTYDTISLWEQGKSYPDLECLVALCEFFDVSADYILGIEK